MELGEVADDTNNFVMDDENHNEYSFDKQEQYENTGTMTNSAFAILKESLDSMTHYLKKINKEQERHSKYLKNLCEYNRY